jgi:hypothetical protein
MQRSLLAALLAALLLPTAIAPAARGDWIFRQGYYTHSPTTGGRIAQYSPLPQLEPLPDTRQISSGYRRSRTTLRGPGGTVDDYYRVENWGNGRGGLDAEWERVHSAWQNSVLAGGYANRNGRPNYGYGGQGNGGPGYGGPGYGGPGYGGPGYSGPGYGGPGYGGPGYGGPGYGGPGYGGPGYGGPGYGGQGPGGAVPYGPRRGGPTGPTGPTGGPAPNPR